MFANVFFAVLVLILLIAFLQGFFVLLAFYPKIAFGLVMMLICFAGYYDFKYIK
jgi:hypothetical protein